ncbi:MAG TPA: hypothetical protein VK284_09440 [Streptosporangiaceae bacterium]|nr:hypothetical protein [Streptosporangiaceae bacterium]
MLISKMHRPASPSVMAYRTQAQSQIGGYGVGQSLVNASGVATVRVGPSGLGTLWFPQQAILSTTTGATDSSTAIGYLGPAGVVAANILFQSYQGGGDVQGIAIPVLQPGDFVTAVWSGGHPGDWATLRIVGTLQALTP